MRIATLLLLLTAPLICACRAELVYPTQQEAEVLRIEALSQEQKYEEIFASLGLEYRKLVDKPGFIKTSRQLGWKMTKTQLGTVIESGDVAYAPIRCKTIIGSRALIIDTVAFFVREDGRWRLWNFPFASPHLLDRPSIDLPRRP